MKYEIEESHYCWAELFPKYPEVKRKFNYTVMYTYIVN